MNHAAIQQLGYIGLGVSDLDAWEELLTKVIGLSRSDGSPEDARLFRADDHLYRIALHADVCDDLLYVGWQVHAPQDIEDIARRATAWGCTVSEEDEEVALHRKVQRLITLTDPEGLPTEVFYGPYVCSDPFVPGRPSRGFVSEGTGLGHVVVASSDSRGTEAFYRKVLGFRVADYGSATLTFLRCNRRHHSIALKPVENLEEGRRLFHLMIEMQSIDDVGRALDLSTGSPTPPVTTIGRHVNDRAISFYLRTPSDFEMECACDSWLVDDDTWEANRYTSREVWGHKRLK